MSIPPWAPWWAKAIYVPMMIIGFCVRLILDTLMKIGGWICARTNRYR